MPIDWLTPVAALLTGLMGGVHCAAMCGGIAAGFSALPGEGGWRRALEPNLGRIAGYTFAGALAGGLGYGIVGLARTEWIMPASRMLLGLVLIIAALRLLDRNGRLIFLPRPGAGLWQWLRPRNAGCCRPTAPAGASPWACCGAGCHVASAPRCWPRPGCRQTPATAR
jgi:hypothetical protein